MPKRGCGAGMRFFKTEDGSTAIQFALAIIPITGLMAVGIDYGRAIHIRNNLQASLDAAVLAAAKHSGESDWHEIAAAVFGSNAPAQFALAAPTITEEDEKRFVGTLAVTVPTELVGILGISTIDLTVDAVASLGGAADNSCILTLDAGSELEHDSIVLSGAPNIQLDQCTLRSNTSLNCNGHDGGAIASIAAGLASGCSNSEGGADPVPDTFAALSAGIMRKCSGSGGGGTWSPGKPPAGAITVSQNGYTEYHICGTLTLAGNGHLTGSAPTSDTVIIIEDGGLIIEDKAAISTARTAIVLTGNNSYSSRIEFPNGKGKAASLSLSPPTGASNPWRGIALYQDPALTKDVNHDWGPAVTFNPDGVVYLPNSDLLMRGSGATGLSGCTKFVTNSFRTNGSVDLKYNQSISACESLGVEQWVGSETFLSL